MSIKVNPLHVDSVTGTPIDNMIGTRTPINGIYNPNDWDEPFAPQGWQCPICKRVYSPSTPWCYFCGNTEVKTTITTTTTSDGSQSDTSETPTAVMSSKYTFISGFSTDNDPEETPKVKMNTCPPKPKKRKVYRAKVNK